MFRNINKTKIAMLVTSLKPVGPVNVAVDVARLCNERKFVDVTIVSLRDNTKKDLAYVNSLGLRVKELHMRKLPTLRQAHEIRTQLQSYDIIHAHSFWPTVIITGVKTCKVTTIHNNPFQDFVYEYGRVIGYTMAFMLTQLSKRYDKVVSISAYVDSVMKINNSVVIYNGVKDVNIKNALSDSQVCFNITCISSLTRIKNLFELIDLVKLCIDQGMKIHCTIIGGGVLRDKLTKYAASLGLDGVFTFTGQIDKHDGYLILSKSDCLVHTSLSEGFGLVVAEAYMLSKPVVVKDIPVMRELVSDGKTGYLYSSSSDFAKKVGSLYRSKKFKTTMGKNAHILYKNNFTDINMANLYYNEYCLLTNTKSKSEL